MQSFQEEDYTKRFDLSLWKKLLHLAKPFHKNLFMIIGFMSVSAIIDVALPMMNSYAIDHFITGQTMQGITGFVALYIALVTVQVITILGFLRQSGHVEVGMCYHIRRLGFQKLQELPFSYYDRMPVGYLMS
ncbi:MAG: ABC transporter transmembrane domain-containing protein, partial [Aristaeellaceae bacterium]